MSIKDKYLLTFVLHALGDTIGFKNSDWKMDYDRRGDIGTINEFVYEFIDLGGVNGIDISNWLISSDTIYHMAIANSVLKFKKVVDKLFIDNTKNNIIRAYNRMISDKKNRIFRYEGATTARYLEQNKMKEGFDASNLPYDSKSGGNGVAGRSLCIGLAFWKEEDLNKLVEVSVKLGTITHNSPLGFLSGMTTALFTSFAIREIDITKWPHMLIKILESDLVKNFIKTEITEVQFDYMDYVRYWKKYIDTRFVDEKPIKSRSTSNLIFRIKYYYENFVKGTKSSGIAVSGFCAVIMAYDALLDCDGIWEKIIFYAILNPSDSSTVGAIAGGLYGAIYGLGDIPNKMLEHIEEGNELIKLGNKFYKNFYKK
jgi:ADP-ribosylglycohydrolase